MNRLKIEIQYFLGCPNSKRMIENVMQAVKGNEHYIDISEILVEDNVTAEKVKFRGSPTVLINGIDLINEPEPEQSAQACRFYPNGLPDVNSIKLIIEQFLKRNDGT